MRDINLLQKKGDYRELRDTCAKDIFLKSSFLSQKDIQKELDDFLLKATEIMLRG